MKKNIDLISGIALKSKELADDKFGTPILRGINITEGQIRHSDESALDELILAQSEKIEQLQQHKKGLMQGLFP
ncbi:MAG: hypothetical protein R6U19_10410 [Bacteroidales bacterium]